MATPVADTSTLPQDLGQTRTTQTMNGYVGGLVEQRNGNTFKTVVPSSPSSTQPTDVSISTNAQTNQAMGTIVMRGLDGTLLPTATLQLGGQSGANGPASAFIDDSRYAMITQTNDPDRQSTRAAPLRQVDHDQRQHHAGELPDRAGGAAGRRAALHLRVSQLGLLELEHQLQQHQRPTTSTSAPTWSASDDRSTCRRRAARPTTA